MKEEIVKEFYFKFGMCHWECDCGLCTERRKAIIEVYNRGLEDSDSGFNKEIEELKDK